MRAAQRTTRRVLKWAGGSACAVLLFLWLRTSFWAFGFIPDAGVVLAFNGPDLEILSESDVGWLPSAFSLGADAVLIVPYWCLLVPAMICTFLLWRTKGRARPGHCQQCTYNLTGNTSGVCPECGTKIET